MRRFLAALALVSFVGSAAIAETPIDKLLARTDKVAKEVAKVRGLRLKKSIPNEVVDQDELRRRLVAIASEDKTHRQTLAEGLALARWGLIPLATDYKALLIDLLTEQIAGYYDPRTKKLTISTGAGGNLEWAEMVLAHEIDHGLQDQHFDLDAFEDMPDAEADASAARRALVEGDGIAVMVEVMLARQGAAAPWSNPEVAVAMEKAMSVPGNEDKLDKAPLAIRESLIFPYKAGLSFVAALRRRQPWSAVDRVYKNPPQSTEQILHPERYLAGDAPIALAFTAPSTLAGYTIAHETVWGELGFNLFLRSHGVDPRAAAIAAEGWGGDRVITLAKGDDRRPQRAVGAARFEWDSEVDAIEAAEAAEKALAAWVTGATIEREAQRTRWLGLDGTVSWIERKGVSLVIVTGAPAWAADALAAEVWTASQIKKPAKAAKPRSRPKR